jgi:hypothetical protein
MLMNVDATVSTESQDDTTAGEMWTAEEVAAYFKVSEHDDVKTC